MTSVKRKERTLTELFNVSQMITEPEITPVLRGSCRMQGPVDETDSDIQSNTVLSRDEKGLDRHSKSRKVLMRAESGMCNVCSAPCSSCLHINRAVMGSKIDEFSDETCQGNAGSQYSVNAAVPVKRNPCDSDQSTASETSNLISVNSNHDSLSEHAESKASLRTCDVSGACEDVEMHPSSGKSVSCNPNVKDLEEDLGSHLPVKLPECSKEHLNSSLIEEAASDMVCGQKSASYTRGGTNDGSLVGGNSVASDGVFLNLEAETETGTGSGDLPTEAVIKEIEKVKEPCGLTGVQETSLQSQPVDDGDESDILEHDVKVCDICGDAGREDLLAICSRCSDGAEHIYCMRESMEKVPDGVWLCEECKFDDEIKNLKQDKIVTVDGNDKNQSSGLANAQDTNLFAKLDRKDSYVEGNKTNEDSLSAKTSDKRHAENIEVVSAAKRQALEPTVGSPETSSPSRVAVLSRDSSFRNLDKGKVKPTNLLSFGTCSINNISEAAFTPTVTRIQTPRGTLLKSNSFNSISAKPKVELVDEVVLQKHKSARESASLDLKEGAVRLMEKSMSFKSVNPGRLNPSESKVKMLSPKFSHGQDLKGLKQAKDWNLLERKNSFKLERPTVSMLKGDKKLSCYGESYSLPSVSKNHEPKGMQSDSKLSVLSKSTSQVARRGSEMPVPSGEIKRQSSSASVGGASSTNGISSSAEQKPNQTNLMADPSSITSTAERPFCNVNEGLPDESPQPGETTNLGARIRVSSVRSRPSITTGGRSAPCQKCKEVGHSAQFCTVVSPRFLAVDASAASSSREVMNKGNKLKAAIEAAMLKKPGIYRKNKMPDQSDELSMSRTNLNCEIRAQDQLSTSVDTRNTFSADEVHEGQAVLQNSAADSCKQTIFNNMPQLSPLPSEAAILKTGDIGPIIPSDGKRFVRDFPSHASAEVSVLLKMSAIPEHEYIWQGDFEVHKSGKLPELRDGIQAHLSTCAAPKVLEVANKFPSKILLNEVPRLSTWPVRFQETGVKEDNIALYFFAKTLESYEKSYKSLLETLMKSDLALKGNFEGVELLIFPSNHLPEKSQRWNMMYFLWGVFRGKKVNCLQNVSGSPKKYFIPRDIPTAIMSSPENIYSLGPIDGDLPTSSKACNGDLASECPSSMESPCLSSEMLNGDCDPRASSIDPPRGQCLQENVHLLDATSLSRRKSTSALSFQETSCNSTPLEDNVEAACKLDVKRDPSVEAARTISGSKKSEKILMYPDNLPDIQQISSRSFEIPARVNGSKDQVTFEKTLGEGEESLDTKAVLETETTMRDQTMKVLNNWQFNPGKRLHEDPRLTVSQASAGLSQTSWNDMNSVFDRGFPIKIQKAGFSGFSVGNNSSRNTSLSSGSFVSGIYDVGISFPMKERGEAACNEREMLKNNGTAERFLFPVDPVKDFSSGENSVPWKLCSSEDDDRLPDAAPNLELALGAEMKPLKQGILPFLGGKVDLNDDQDHLPENAATKEEEDVSASLSLSLSFPFPDKELTVKPVSKIEQLLPDRRHVNTSLLLFDSLSDK